MVGEAGGKSRRRTLTLGFSAMQRVDRQGRHMPYTDDGETDDETGENRRNVK